MNFDSHHAYLIESKSKDNLTLLREQVLEYFGMEQLTHPDVVEVDVPQFLLEHASSVKEADLKMPLVAKQKIIFIFFESITREAQNALLKVFEEPSATSKFFIVASNTHVLLQTLLSRLQRVEISFNAPQKKLNAGTFLKKTLGERLEEVSNIIKKVQDDELRKDDIVTFVSDIEHEYKKAKQYKQAISCLKQKEFILDKSSSLKLVLERVALL